MRSRKLSRYSSCTKVNERQQRNRKQRGEYDAQDHDSHPLDQSVGQTQARAPALFGARHAPAVGFMVHAQQMQHAMEHQDLDFLFGSVAEFARLRAGAGERNGEIAKR